MPNLPQSLSIGKGNDEMKFLLLSDTHLLWHKPVGRIDDTKETQFGKWNFILDYASKNKYTILEAGDFFNANRSWYLLPEVMDMLKKYHIEIFCCYGQHDTYLYNEKTRAATSLGILEKAGLVHILDEKFYQRQEIEDKLRCNIYGCSYGQKVPKIKNKDCFNILIIHAPIAEKALYPNQNYLDATTFLKENEFDLIVAGDIHQKYAVRYENRWIVNSGPLIRKEASAYNFLHSPGFYIFDTKKIDPPEFIEVPHRSAEEVLSRNHIDAEKESDNLLNDFVSSILDINVEEGISFAENLWNFVKENKIERSVVDLLSEVINAKIDSE